MFRILPGVGIADPDAIWTTFENVKFALNSALLTFHTTMLVDEIIGFKEMAVPFKIPYFIDPTSLQTTSIWSKGAMTVDVSVLAQNTSFSVHILGANFGVSPTTVIFSQNYNCPAGAKLYYFFTDVVPEVDLQSFDGIIVAPEVPVKPIPADRYVITTQLTFRPFKPFGVA